MRVKRIVLLLLVILGVYANISYGKYVYTLEEEIIELTRDSDFPTYTISYSTQELTNESVTVTIDFSKEVEQVSGFTLSEDGKTLSKEIPVNETKTMIVRDLSGNSSEIEYSVNNIDKGTPQIMGCEDGGTYLAPLELEYFDDNEIKEVLVDRYSNYLWIAIQKEVLDSNLTVVVQEHPLHTKKYRYYLNEKLYATSMDSSYTFTGLNPEEVYTVKVQNLDSEGNILGETIREAKTSDFDIISNPEEEKDDIYHLTKSGNYQIKVTDLAGNETVYYIKIK